MSDQRDVTGGRLWQVVITVLPACLLFAAIALFGHWYIFLAVYVAVLGAVAWLGHHRRGVGAPGEGSKRHKGATTTGAGRSGGHRRR